MFDVLDILIEQILELYGEINQRWKTTDNFLCMNLKKKQVLEIPQSDELWNMIKSYRSFMEIQQLIVLGQCSKIQTENNRITARIKHLNSIEYKIHRYISGSLEGKVAISKCFNDLFGIRIIIDSEFSHDDLKNHIQMKYPGLKLTDSSKNTYNASHIYFMMENTLFPWELQIWRKNDEADNLESHKIYKQDYISWEEQYKKQ